jgi:2-keto-myo-inositol isomerase
MKLALNGATIMQSSLANDVRVAAETGFTHLELWAGKFDTYVREHLLGELADQMRSLNVRPSCINSIEDITHRDAAGRAELIARLRQLVVVAGVLDAPSIVVVPGVRPAGAGPKDSARDAVEVLRVLSDVAGDVGLAFEFLGKPGCSVSMLNMAVEIVGAVDRKNVGMVIDTFHFHAGGSDLADLAVVPVDKLLVVHLNGCEDVPANELTDAHRLYPGEGVIPINAILRRLRERGFDGTASIEIFRPAYWKLDAHVVARTAREKAVDVLTAAGFLINH